MNLFEIDHIHLDLEVSSKDELFNFIANTLKALGRITESADFKKALEKRESEISTGLGEGIGMPHTLDTSVMFPTMLYIRLKNEIDYQAIDGLPVKEIYAIAMPNSYQKEHLELISKIASIYIDEASKEEIRALDTKESIHSFISKNLK
ncbi:PTS sugar transporter subunit IIA [Acholeplasma laidlawii]|uniref:PTS sugar transporter subunit IIA n=1 Tax=Acholeplasma laidlawii TaxID=2148 RepID=UPI002541B62F|nr:PTS sugar transporter subunit IIA [Acholeplasma laidlawii]